MNQDQQQSSQRIGFWKKPRVWARLTALFLTLALLGPLSGPIRTALPTAASPFISVNAILASRSVHLVGWVGLAMALAVTIRRRLFCRVICPMGLILDSVGRMGRVCGRTPAGCGGIGRWLAWATIGGGCLGIPFFLWMDPMAILGAAFSVFEPGASIAKWVGLFSFLAILIATVFRPGIWCWNLCPLGAFQEILYEVPRLFRVLLGARKAKGGMGARSNCRGISRRAWFGVTGGIVGGTAVQAFPATSRSGLLRPPGARPEPEFNALCLRCGNCVRACPTNIIQQAGVQEGLLTLFTPILSFKSDYCREDCVRCTEVCPSGALRGVGIGEKSAVQLGRPQVNLDHCLLFHDRECSFCRRYCPTGAISYEFSWETYTSAPRVNLDICNGCGACEVYCPATPQKAITILPLGG